MNTFLLSNLFLALFFGVYAIFFRKETHFQWNRALLLGSVPLSFGWPLVFLFFPKPGVDALPSMLLELPEFTVGAPVESTSTLPWFYILYWSGVAVATCLFLVRVAGIYVLSKNSLPEKFAGSFLYKTFLNGCTEEIIFHEKVHVHQGHSLDLLFLELVKILCWFNPVVYFLQKELKTIHEYLADNATAKWLGDTQKYARILVATKFDASSNTLIHSFNSYSNLKKRLLMLQRKQSNRTSLLKYSIIAPLLLGMAFSYTACTEQNIVKQSAIDATKEAEAASLKNGVYNGEEVFFKIDTPPNFPGGMKALYAFLGENIQYPATAKSEGVSGRVFVKFIVDKNGEIQNPEILQSPDTRLADEAIRVIQGMPKWEPGKQDDEFVNVYYTMPIVFQLGSEKDKQVKDPYENADVYLDGKKTTWDEVKKVDKNRIATINIRKANSDTNSTGRDIVEVVLK